MNVDERPGSDHKLQRQLDARRADYRVGDAYGLPFPDGSFDLVVASQVLLHLADPWHAVREMRRTLSPGGRPWIGEWDWDSTCLAVSDVELGRRSTHALCEKMRNPLIVRDLGWRLREERFAEIDVSPQVRLSHELDATFQWLIEPAARELARTGALDPEEGDRPLQDLRQRARTGRYFLARTYHTIIAVAV